MRSASIRHHITSTTAFSGPKPPVLRLRHQGSDLGCGVGYYEQVDFAQHDDPGAGDFALRSGGVTCAVILFNWLGLRLQQSPDFFAPLRVQIGSSLHLTFSLPVLRQKAALSNGAHSCDRQLQWGSLCLRGLNTQTLVAISDHPNEGYRDQNHPRFADNLAT